ncbi:hypothetical protein pqer_cds_1050 [Pandoravirus quercus]|uniref:Uncharacterized protein n=2 Tax=Pandoravirus TaxID=2060084 RepID=A0A2U7UAQ0_9VIRU|nr:hypothetical protein pqer_cds_1050 [Pandoravirus quercus]AVK75472.1 hypothetical protein pqer_cds_1050 [Pandoravirus quercus]QBZ81652.1 hypothetical protein pclt_cds_1069 [Pandoravirus celtis]
MSGNGTNNGTHGLCPPSDGSNGASQTVLVTNQLASTSIAVHAERVRDLPRPAPILGPGAQFHTCTRNTDSMVVRIEITAVGGSAPGLPYHAMLGFPKPTANNMAFDIRVTPQGVHLGNA